MNEQDMVDAARAVQKRAHAPYSKYHVGAALLDDAGHLHVGCNVENATFGATVCAERNAVAAMVAAGGKRLTHVVIVTREAEPVPPCGLCRQVLAEFAGDDALVVGVGTGGKRREWTLGALLPDAFRSF